METVTGNYEVLQTNGPTLSVKIHFKGTFKERRKFKKYFLLYISMYKLIKKKQSIPQGLFVFYNLQINLHYSPRV